MNQNLQSRPYTAWQLLKVYWQSEARWVAYAFLSAVFVMTIAIVGMQVVLNNWHNFFYNALQDYNKSAVIDLMVIFTFLAAVYIVLQVYRYYVSQFFGLRWRRWLTNQFIMRWLEKRSYYYLENFDEQTDNPDQRIQEDINALVLYTIELSVGLVASIATFFAFIYILWTLSGYLDVPLGKYGTLHIPGYLVWAAVIYALVGTIFTYRIGRPLVPLNFDQQRFEANFRFAAVDLREHAENVALYRGENQQKSLLNRLVDRFLNNWYQIILRQKQLLWFTASYNQISVLLPLMVALPNYFRGFFRLGGLMQTLYAFNYIQEALSFIVASYTRIAEWQAVMKRLLTFLNHMYQVENDAINKNNFSYHIVPENKIIVNNLTILTPRDQTLLKNINQEFIHGKNYVIKGPSGIGKSTFIRTIARIWPYGSGEIFLPAEKNIMYIPQKTYMPLGTLREALLFPDSLRVGDDVLVNLLNECGLHYLASDLNKFATWSDQLSPGEQQRIAFVRIFLQKPDWVFLDESTSSLDADNQLRLYTLLKKLLPNCSMISVGHLMTIDKFHDQQIDLGEYQTAREPA